MNHRFASVLFDLDGTLVDTAPDFHTVINLLLKEEGRHRVSFDLLRQHVSNGARAMISAAFQLQESDEEFPRLHKRMLEIYLTHLDKESTLFPGIKESLNWLQANHIPWGVVTNKPELYTIPVLKGLGIIDHAQSIVCPDHVNNRKPHPEPLFLACKQLNKTPEHSVYVGDHIRDIEAGNRAGMLTIGASYGYLNDGEDPASWQADHYINSATELQPLLKSIFKEIAS